MLKYKVVSLNYPDAEIYIEAQKVTEKLTFSDYLNEVVDKVSTHQIMNMGLGAMRWVFHPERSYTKVEQYNDVFRIETGELCLVNKDHKIQVGDYIRYDPMIDEMARWDEEAARQTPSLILVE